MIQRRDTVDLIPIEIWIEIIRLLGIRELLRLSAVSRKFRYLIHHTASLWKWRCKRDFSHLMNLATSKSDRLIDELDTVKHWKKLYIKFYWATHEDTAQIDGTRSTSRKVKLDQEDEPYTRPRSLLTSMIQDRSNEEHLISSSIASSWMSTPSVSSSYHSSPATPMVLRLWQNSPHRSSPAHPVVQIYQSISSLPSSPSLIADGSMTLMTLTSPHRRISVTPISQISNNNSHRLVIESSPAGNKKLTGKAVQSPSSSSVMSELMIFDMHISDSNSFLHQ